MRVVSANGTIEYGSLEPGWASSADGVNGKCRADTADANAKLKTYSRVSVSRIDSWPLSSVFEFELQDASVERYGCDGELPNFYKRYDMRSDLPNPKIPDNEGYEHDVDFRLPKKRSQIDVLS